MPASWSATRRGGGTSGATRAGPYPGVVRELPPSSKYRSSPERGVDDVEREDLNRRLNDAYADGALEVAEYRELLDRVFGARTLGELVPVVAALPEQPTHLVPAVIETGSTRPGEVEVAANVGNRVPLVAAGLLAGGVSLAVVLLLLVLL